MDITTFNAHISTILKHGSEFDSLIPTAAARAARHFERNHTFLYMEVERTLSIAKDDTTITTSARMKKVVSAWYTISPVALSPGTVQFLEQIDPGDTDILDESVIEATNPIAYWVQSQSVTGVLVLRLVPGKALEALTGKIIEGLFTDWANLGGGTTPWLLEFAEDLMEYQTVIQMAPWLKDPELIQLNIQLRDDGLNTVMAIDEELRQSTRSPEIRYGRQY